MKNLTVCVWIIGEAAGYSVIRGNLAIVLCGGHIRDIVIAEATRLAVVIEADLIIAGKLTPITDIPPDRLDDLRDNAQPNPPH